MKVGALKQILATYADDIELVIGLERHDDKPTVALRDIVDLDDHNKVETVLNIRHWNYGKIVGLPHLTAEERNRQRRDILTALAEPTRFHGGKRFTAIHGDYRIYSDFGGGNDTCYGTAYDPRVFQELLAEGLLISRRMEMSGLPDVEISDQGRAAVAEMSLGPAL